MTSYLDNGYDVMNYFAKFAKFLPYSIITPSFMTVGSQMPELDRGAFLPPPPPPYKLGSHNTPYKLGLNHNCLGISLTCHYTQKSILFVTKILFVILLCATEVKYSSRVFNISCVKMNVTFICLFTLREPNLLNKIVTFINSYLEVRSHVLPKSAVYLIRSFKDGHEFHLFKSVQSTLSHLQGPSERMQSQRNYGSFL